ncbi:tetratricopeptide repeat protein [Polyangium sp. 15x6]|uniref:tetratricopeptide repeat protein n=1 Tax=Polyangium sp. 15x6 TaxID=3042687 RepID=UPI00249CDE52|nr:tetratricopeptide repeat protein [Polyangium sp. 15x6]MDI3285077.1 tetratricopeptide repeat protein [Polyangium sp. 15x6]
MDHARPERLRDLVLALLPTYPDVEVYTDVRAVYEVPEGAVMVLAPRAEDADWLNMQRPVFARRRLKVILWCDAETSVTLVRKAFDFFDWISHRHECPPGVPMHAVFGIRAALCARVLEIGWIGDNLEACFHAALPGRRLIHLSAKCSHEKLVQTIRGAGRAWFMSHDADDPRRVARALAEFRVKTRIFWVGDWPLRHPWTINSRCRNLVEARTAIASLGTRSPGRLVALAGLEPEAVEAIELGLRCGVPEIDFERSMRSAADPGAAVARLVETHVPPIWDILWRPLLWRGLGRRGIWPAGEPYGGKRHVWVTIFAAKDALLHGNVDDAEAWVNASLVSASRDPGTRSLEYVSALRVFAFVVSDRGDFSEAESTLLYAIRLAEVRLGPDDPFLGGLYGDLAEVLAQKGDFDEADRLAERAFQIEKSIPSLSSPYMSRAYKRFAYIQSLKDAAAAEVHPDRQ